MISCNQNIFHEIINSFYLTKMITKAPIWHRDCKQTVILSFFYKICAVMESFQISDPFRLQFPEFRNFAAK